MVETDKTNKQDDLEHDECSEETKPWNGIERDGGAVLGGRDAEGLSEEVMLRQLQRSKVGVGLEGVRKSQETSMVEERKEGGGQCELRSES